MSSVPSEVLNELFVSKLDSEAGKEKIAALGGDYIRDRLREESFARKILPPKTVSRSDLQVSVSHDTLVKIVEVEPQSRAMSMSFRGQPSVKYYTGPRFEVPFHTVGSERYEQTEQELMAYTMPITEIIRRNIVNDIQEVEDTVFLNHMESACQSLQQDAQGLTFGDDYAAAAAFSAKNVNGGVAEVGKVKGVDVLQNSDSALADAAACDEDLAFPVQKDDFIKLFQLFTGSGNRGSRLRCDQFLMTDTDFEDLNAWAHSDMGDKIVGETTVDGYKYSTVIGRKFVRTLKTDILRPGNIYAFCAQEFLGGFLLLNKTKFYADKERNRVSFEAWEDIGMYVGNVAGVRKLELYAGSVETVTGAPNPNTRAARLPVSEEDLGSKNNLVEEGETFPKVTSF
tara:strand:- start:1729 stop:2922 length:1194 start_codon:yes stop_codon:yes gene_type:complete